MKEIIKPFHFADRLQKILVVTYPKKKNLGQFTDFT